MQSINHFYECSQAGSHTKMSFQVKVTNTLGNSRAAIQTQTATVLAPYLATLVAGYGLNKDGWQAVDQT